MAKPTGHWGGIPGGLGTFPGFYIDPNGVGIFSSVPTPAVLGLAANTPPVQIHSTGIPSLGIFDWSNDTSSPQLFLHKSRGNAIGNHVAVQSGDVLGGVVFCGSIGTAFAQGGQCNVTADGAWSASSSPGRFIIGTTPSGSQSVVERFRLDNTGNLILASTGVSAQGVPGGTPQFQMHHTGSSFNVPVMSMNGWSTTASGPQMSLNLSRGGGTVGTQGAVTLNDRLGIWVAGGSDGTALINAGYLGIYVDGTVSTNIVPTRLTLATMNTSGSLVEGLKIDSAQTVTVLASTASSSTTTGALVVTGGLGVGGIIYTGGGANITGNFSGGLTFSSTQSSNINSATGLSLSVTHNISAVIGCYGTLSSNVFNFNSGAGGANGTAHLHQLIWSSNPTGSPDLPIASIGLIGYNMAPVLTGTRAVGSMASIYYFACNPIIFSLSGSPDANNYTITSAYNFSANDIGSSKPAGVTLTNLYGFYCLPLTSATNNYVLYGAGAGMVSTGDSIKTRSPTGGMGYETGAGGTVTQTTSRTTAVTVNKVCGAITLVSAAGSTNWLTFTVNNSTVVATDTIIVNQKSGTDRYMITVTAVGSGTFDISFARPSTGGSPDAGTVEQPVFNFAVIKAVTA